MSYGTTFNLKMNAFTQCCIRRITSRHAVLWISCNSTDSTSFFLPRPRQSESVGKARQRIDACEYAAGNAAACDISRSCNHQSPRHTGCSTEEAIIHSLGEHTQPDSQSHTIHPEALCPRPFTEVAPYNGARGREEIRVKQRARASSEVELRSPTTHPLVLGL